MEKNGNPNNISLHGTIIKDIPNDSSNDYLQTHNNTIVVLT